MNIFTKLSLQLQLSLEEYFQQEMIDFDRNVFKIIFLAFRGVNYHQNPRGGTILVLSTLYLCWIGGVIKKPIQS